MKQAPALVVGIESDAASDDSESKDAAKDILSAIKKGDATALDMALQRHYATCGDMDEGDDDDEEEAPKSRRY